MSSAIDKECLNIKAGKRVTYVLSRLPHFFYHDSIITALCERGVYVNLLFIKRAQIDKDDPNEELKIGVLERISILEAYKKRYPSFSFQEIKKEQRSINTFCLNLRFIRSYASYLQRISKENYYVRRWFSWMPKNAQNLCMNSFIQRILKFSFIIDLLERIDLALPANKEIVGYLEKHKPDIVLVSPANTRTISDAEWIKAAKKTGIKSGVVVLSWDNLTTKGLIHIRPDWVFLWNKTQANDAIRIHHINKKKLKITGAYFFDKWRDVKGLLQPRDEFMRSQGLDPALPYIAYLGSSKNISDDETWLIKALAEALEASDNPALKHLQIFVRPHSSNLYNVKNVQTPRIILTDNAYIGVPFSKARQINMFNAFYHSTATVSINTSAIIDAILIGKSCITIQTDKYNDTHTGSAHFKNLLDANAVYLASNIEECLSAISQCLAGENLLNAERDTFVREFIHSPEGNKSAGDTLVDFLFSNAE